jgi:hypothetical protein
MARVPHESAPFMIVKGFQSVRACCEMNEAAASAPSQPDPRGTTVSPRQGTLKPRFHHVTPRANDDTRVPMDAVSTRSAARRPTGATAPCPGQENTRI